MTTFRCIWITGAVWLLCEFGAASLRADETEVPQTSGIDVVLLIDSSQSTQRTDPQDHRLKAAHFLLDYLEATSEALRVNHRAAIANFGGELGEAVPLQLVGYSRVHEAIKEQTIPNTDFRPALEFAIRELRHSSAGTGRQRIVVLFTDGLPDFGSGTLEGDALDTYFRGDPIPGDAVGSQLVELIRELQEIAAELFVVAVGQEPAAARGWKSVIADSSYVELESTEQLATAYHRIFSEKLGLEDIAQYRIEAEQPKEISFDALVEHATLSFIKEKAEGRIMMQGPGGERTRRIGGGGAEDQHEVYEISRPKAMSDWAVAISSGSAWLLVALRRPHLFVQEPFTPQPSGAPISLIVSLGQRVGAKVPADLRLTATLMGPEFDEPLEVVLNRLVAEDRFKLITPPVTEPGAYSIQLAGRLNNMQVPGLVRDLEVQTLPAPEIVSIELDELNAGDRRWMAEVVVKDTQSANLRGTIASIVENQLFNQSDLRMITEEGTTREEAHLPSRRFVGELQLPSNLEESSIKVSIVDAHTPGTASFIVTREIPALSLTTRHEGAHHSYARHLLPFLALIPIAAYLIYCFRRPPSLILSSSNGAEATHADYTSYIETMKNEALSEKHDNKKLLQSIKIFWDGVERNHNKKQGSTRIYDCAEAIVSQLECGRLTLQRDAYQRVVDAYDGVGALSSNPVELMYEICRRDAIRYLRMEGRYLFRRTPRNPHHSVDLFVESQSLWARLQEGELDSLPAHDVRLLARDLAQQGKDLYTALYRSDTNEAPPAVLPPMTKHNIRKSDQFLAFTHLYSDLLRLAEIEIEHLGGFDNFLDHVPSMLRLVKESYLELLSGKRQLEVVYMIHIILSDLCSNKRDFILNLDPRIEEIEKERFRGWPSACPEKTILVLLFRSWRSRLQDLLAHAALSDYRLVPLTTKLPVAESRVTELRVALSVPPDSIAVGSPGAASLRESSDFFVPEVPGRSSLSRWPIPIQLESIGDNLFRATARVKYRLERCANKRANFLLELSREEAKECEIKLEDGSTRLPQEVDIKEWYNKHIGEARDSERCVVAIAVKNYKLGELDLDSKVLEAELGKIRDIRLSESRGLGIPPLKEWKEGVGWVVVAGSCEHAQALAYGLEAERSERPNLHLWRAYLDGFLEDQMDGLTCEAAVRRELEEYLRVADAPVVVRIMDSLRTEVRASRFWYISSAVLEDARLGFEDNVLAQMVATIRALDEEEQRVLSMVRRATDAAEHPRSVREGDTDLPEALSVPVASVDAGNVAIESTREGLGENFEAIDRLLLEESRLTKVLASLCDKSGILERVNRYGYRFSNRLYYKAAREWSDRSNVLQGSTGVERP